MCIVSDQYNTNTNNEIQWPINVCLYLRIQYNNTIQYNNMANE